MLCKGFIINAKNYLNVFWPLSHCISSVLWLGKARPGKRYNVYTKMKCSDRMCCKYLYPWLSVTDWKFMVHIDRAILAIIVCTLLWPPSRHVGGVWRCSKWKVHYMVAWDFTQENVWNTVSSWLTFFCMIPFCPGLGVSPSFLYLQLGPLATKIFSDQRICADQTISESFAKQSNLILVGKDPQSSQCESPMNGLL